NKKADIKNSMVEMANGHLGFSLPPDNALFLNMLNFKPKNSFYQSDIEKLGILEKLINDLSFEEVVAMSWYIGKKMGMRLSPTIALTNLIRIAEEGLERQKLKFAMREVFTRPDFLANSFGYIKYTDETEIKEVAPWVKKTYCKILESYSDITLKKRKMEDKEIKLSDLIKVLRPNPLKARITNKELYKAIIERTLDSKLTVDIENEVAESIVSVLSNDNIAETKKADIIQKSLKDMAINDIIRNIANIEATQENQEIILGKLSAMMKRDDALRFINPFDLIMVSDTVDNAWKVGFDNILVEFVKKNVGNIGKTQILFDVSGSMNWGNTRWSSRAISIQDEGFSKALKFLSLLRPILDSDTIINFFSEQCWTDESVAKIIKRCKTPNNFYNAMFTHMVNTTCEVDDRWWHGTHLMKTLTDNTEFSLDNDTKNLLIMTDEFTYDNVTRMNDIKSIFADRKVIIYNVDQSDTSAFSLDSNVLRCTGYDGKVL
ncbi:MAG: hypothetical protein ACRC42_01965, partial [Mycoplasma sp.]